MKTLKSFTKSLVALTLGLTILTQTVAPKRAEAMFLIDQTEYFLPSSGVAATLKCLLLLPLCLFDEKSDQAGAVSASHLRDNGYSEPEIQSILSSQDTIVKILENKKLGIKAGPQDTRESIARDIRSVYPEAPAAYVDFVTESAGLAK